MSQPFNRVFNFSAGPCTLPVEVLEEARDDMMNYKGAGMGVMEMSHRDKAFMAIHEATKADLRALMGIPEDYSILFLQGGASLQNTMVPMNLLNGGSADYVITGAWGKKSYEMGALVGPIKKVYDGKENNYSEQPDLASLSYNADAAYVHVTTNETIHGTEFFTDPSLSAPVVCDMSSDILSRPVDVTKYALIYAGAQKNMGPAGTTVVIIRKDMLERTPANMHPMLDYRVQAENDSMLNTPPCWGIYICGLVYKWLLKNGGLTWMNGVNRQKADAIYAAIDGSGGFYKGHARPDSRSIMNITFTLSSDGLTSAFVKEATAAGLDSLKGHRSVGGCRASIYNAFPLEGCQALASFMADFAARNG
jgi:phosphoserine aminotransferase